MEPVSRVSKICGDVGILGSGAACALRLSQGPWFPQDGEACVVVLKGGLWHRQLCFDTIEASFSKLLRVLLNKYEIIDSFREVLTF